MVSGGLYLSTHRYLFLGSASRIRGVNVWNTLVFLLNGFVFMIIGLSLPHIIANLGEVSLKNAIGYGVLVTGVLILFRIISAYGALVTTLIMRHFITVADRGNPGFKIPFILGGSGRRGVVSGCIINSFSARRRHAFSRAQPGLVYHFCGHTTDLADTGIDVAVFDQENQYAGSGS